MKKKEDNILVKYKDKYIKATLIYRKRKTITIQIKPKDQVTVISPNNVPKEKLEELVREKGNWILNKLEEYKDIDIPSEKEYKNGEILYYLGKSYTLKIEKSNKAVSKIYICDNNIVFETNNEDYEYIQQHLKQWYKKESEKIVLERIIYWREKSPTMMKLVPSILKVKEQKKRWGTCTSKKAIYINSKIAMARLSSIDYILVHEFSHLVHMNHSKDFYNLVQTIMPDYKKEVDWLKQNSYKLTL